MRRHIQHPKSREVILLIDNLFVVFQLFPVAFGLGIGIATQKCNALAIFRPLVRAYAARQVRQRLSFAAIERNPPKLHRLLIAGHSFIRNCRRRRLRVFLFGGRLRRRFRGGLLAFHHAELECRTTLGKRIGTVRQERQVLAVRRPRRRRVAPRAVHKGPRATRLIRRREPDMLIPRFPGRSRSMHAIRD